MRPATAPCHLWHRSRAPSTPRHQRRESKARAILAAIRTLQAVEQAQRQATPEERAVLARFPGFGPVALGIFPDPITGRYKDAGWQQLGDQLQALLTPEDYASARRTTFTAFYTAPVVMQAMYAALARLGVPADATVLEPGCGIGNFLAYAPEGMRFIGVELDGLSGAHRPGAPTPATTFVSSISAIRACPRAVSTPSSAMCPSPISGWTTMGRALRSMTSFWPSPWTP